MNRLPAVMPPTGAAAYKQLSAVVKPTLDDLKLMVLIEAAGQATYAGFAAATTDDALRAVFERNGREELAHAHRVSRVIKQLHGEAFEVPASEANPYYAVPAGAVISKEALERFARGEAGGKALYEAWASRIDDPEAVKLLLQNGKEEGLHGERLLEAVRLLGE